MYYESHHTFDLAQEEADAERLLKNIAENNGVKFSKIDGDPLLGEKVYAYITIHSDSYSAMMKKWEQIESHFDFFDLFWIRRKIEHVVRDERRESNSSGK